MFWPPKPKLFDSATSTGLVAGDVGDVVEVAVGVGVVEVERRRQDAVADRQQADDRLDAARPRRSGGPSCSWCWRSGTW